MLRQLNNDLIKRANENDARIENVEETLEEVLSTVKVVHINVGASTVTCDATPKQICKDAESQCVLAVVKEASTSTVKLYHLLPVYSYTSDAISSVLFTAGTVKITGTVSTDAWTKA